MWRITNQGTVQSIDKAALSIDLAFSERLLD